MITLLQVICHQWRYVVIGDTEIICFTRYRVNLIYIIVDLKHSIKGTRDLSKFKVAYDKRNKPKPRKAGAKLAETSDGGIRFISQNPEHHKNNNGR